MCWGDLVSVRFRGAGDEAGSVGQGDDAGRRHDESIVLAGDEVIRQLAELRCWWNKRGDLSMNPGADALRVVAVQLYRLAVDSLARAEEIDPGRTPLDIVTSPPGNRPDTS